MTKRRIIKEITKKVLEILNKLETSWIACIFSAGDGPMRASDLIMVSNREVPYLITRSQLLIQSSIWNCKELCRSIIWEYFTM